MDALINKEKEYNNSVKSIVAEFLEKNEIPYSVIEPDSDGKICIDLEFGYNIYKNKNYYTPLILTMSDKDVCKIYPYEIMYIAIEGRESVMHLIKGLTLKTNYNISYFEGILPNNCFARPHNSYIVNFNYVTKVTNDFVYLKYKEREYKTYTSQRKISTFKKAFLNFGK